MNLLIFATIFISTIPNMLGYTMPSNTSRGISIIQLSDPTTALTSPTTITPQRKFTYQIYPVPPHLNIASENYSAITPQGKSTYSGKEVTLSFEPDYVILANQTPELPESTTNPMLLLQGNLTNANHPVIYSYGVVGKSVKIPCPISFSQLESQSNRINNIKSGEKQELQYVRLLKSNFQDGKVKYIDVFTYAIPPDNDEHYKKSGSLSDRINIQSPKYIIDNYRSIGTLQNLENGVDKEAIENQPYLEIFNLTRKDEGAYVCLPKLRNQLSHQGQKLNLQIMVPPATPSTNYSNEIVYQGESIYINCSTAAAKPMATLAWRKSGQLINENQFIGNSTNKDNETIISWNVLKLNVSRDDLKTLYSCQVDNGYTTNDAIDTTNFKLNAYVRPLQPFIEDIEINLIEGMELELVCKVKGSNPMPSVFWVIQKNQVTQLFNGTYHTIIDTTGTYDVINILKIRLERNFNKAIVLCNATNPVLEKYGEPYLSSNKRLIIKYPPITVHLSHYDIVLIPGNDSYEEIMCDSDANPPALIKWILKGFGGPILSRKNILVLNAEMLLKYAETMRKVSIECRASNEYGSASSYLSVHIHFKPKCLKNNTVHYISSNSSVTLECPISASPPAIQYFWKRKSFSPNFPIDNQSIIPITTITDRTLSINKSQDYATKFGTFYCGAQNLVGTNEQLCVIQVHPADPPLAPQNCSIHHYNLTICIRCSQYNWTLTPQRYVLQGKLLEDKRYKNISVSKYPVFNISYPAISPATIYTFRVLSVNSVGTSVQEFLSNQTQMTIQTEDLKETNGLNIFSITWIIILSVFIVLLLLISALITYTLMKQKGQKKPHNLVLNGNMDHIYADFLNMEKNRDYLHNGKTTYNNIDTNGCHHPSISNYTDMRLTNGPAIMSDDFNLKQMNYTLCLSSVNKSPIIYKNMIPVPNINPTTLTQLRNNNLIYADVETINSHAAKLHNQLPINDYINPTKPNFSNETNHCRSAYDPSTSNSNSNGKVVYSSVVIPIRPYDQYALGNNNNNNNLSSVSRVDPSHDSRPTDLVNSIDYNNYNSNIPTLTTNVSASESIDGGKMIANKTKVAENPLKHSFYLPKKLSTSQEVPKDEDVLENARKKISVHHMSPLQIRKDCPGLKSSSECSTNTTSTKSNDTLSGNLVITEEESSMGSENMDISAII